MTTFTIPIAMDIRAYGSIDVTADTLEEAIKSISAEVVADRFQPHGSAEDLDYNHPVNIVIVDEATDDAGNVFTVDYQPVPDGSWKSSDSTSIHIVTHESSESDVAIMGAYSTHSDAETRYVHLVVSIAKDHGHELNGSSLNYDDANEWFEKHIGCSAGGWCTLSIHETVLDQQ